MTAVAHTPTVDEVRRRQEAFYDAAEIARYEWLTSHPLIRSAERDLMARLPLHEGVPSILEVGCGEGANYETLRAEGARFRYTGFDCFPRKVAFCRQRHAGGRFLLADARRPFPFADGSFEIVLVRDILHHLAEPDRVHVLRDSLRVLAPGGRLVIVEGNAANVIGSVFAWVFPHERCMLQTRAPRLQKFVAATLPGHDIEQAMAEPSNLFRFVCHYQFGVPALGRQAWAAAAFGAWARWSGRLRPSRRWAYSIILVRKTGSTARR